MPEKHSSPSPSSLQIGDRFGRWVVIGPPTFTPGKYWTKHYRYLCRCDCRKHKVVLARSLISGASRSCGCIQRRYAQFAMGKRFGRLVVVGEPYVKGRSCWDRQAWIPCRCDCGTTKDIRGYRLKIGQQSCGCYAADTTRRRMTVHGGTKTRLHIIWRSMISRCRNPNSQSYSRYGGRGVAIHEDWLDFAVFREWACSHGYKDDLSIERRDPCGNYEPSNCEWIPFGQQSKNRRTNYRLTAFGETKIASEWAVDARCAVKYQTLLRRLKVGWPAEVAITSPAHSGIRPNIDAKT